MQALIYASADGALALGPQFLGASGLRKLYKIVFELIPQKSIL